MVTVTVLHETLRIEVTGHALGPVHPLFTSKPAPKTEDGRQDGQVLGDQVGQAAAGDANEVVRLAARARSPGSRRSSTTSAASS